MYCPMITTILLGMLIITNLIFGFAYFKEHNQFVLDNENNLSDGIGKNKNKKREGSKNAVELKKKKGKEKEEMERNKVPIKLFPTLNEKIFDVIEIDGVEYFLDTDFGIIYNDEVKQVGIIKNNKYIMYSEMDITKLNTPFETDDKEINHFIKLYSNK